MKPVSRVIVGATLLVAATLPSLRSAARAADPVQGSAAERRADDEMNERRDEVVRESKQTIDDATFARKAAEGSAMEIALADLALAQSRDEAVRDYAEQIKKDHSAAQAELVKISEGAGVQVAKPLDDDRSGMTERLAKLDGHEFDLAYTTAMVKEHQRDVEFFSAKARASDGDLSAFAQKMVPVLSAHLETARKLSRTVASQQAAPDADVANAARPATAR